MFQYDARSVRGVVGVHANILYIGIFILSLPLCAMAQEPPSESASENSETIRDRVEKARAIQRQRFKNLVISTNAEMGVKEIKNFCKINSEAQELLKNAVQQLYLSARGYHRILKVARTIADLSNSERIEAGHIAEALQYRTKIE